MRILFLTHRLPYPPDKGDKIRAWHLIRCLAKRHDVDVAALADDPADLDPARHAALNAVARRLAVAWRPKSRARLAAATSVARGLPASLPFFHSTELARTVERWMLRDGYDAVIAHSAPMAWYVPDLPGTVRVVDLCDVDSEKWRQYGGTARFPASWIYRREAKLLRRWECKLAREWDSVVVISDAEARLFRSFCGVGRVDVVSNGVDSDHFSPRGGKGREQAGALVFTGAMDYRPNVEGVLWFAREVWPKIRAVRPEATFRVVGPRPTEAVRSLGGRDGVTVTGYVDDVRDELARASVAVAPLHIARGVQNKVLEAMAAGLPVVATAAAHEGIHAVPGRDLLVADGAEAFAESVLALCADAPLRGRIAGAGRRAVIAGHSWDAHARSLEIACGGDRPSVRTPSNEIEVSP